MVVTQRESTSFWSRLLLVAFSIVAAFAYRASVAAIPRRPFEDLFLFILAGLLLLISLLAKSRKGLDKYWEIPFAFFVFTIAGLLGDINVSPLQPWFVGSVLSQSPDLHNPLASSVWGTVGAQVFSSFLLIVPVVVLTKASGSSLSSIYIDRESNWRALAIAVAVFVGFYVLAAFGLTRRFFPNNGMTTSRLLALTPALLIVVLANGIREELWFRGLFLKKYGRFLSPFSSNLLAAIIFCSFHVQVQYSRSLPFFLLLALVEGLLLGLLMQKSRSILAAAIMHAGTDIPIFLVYLSYAQ